MPLVPWARASACAAFGDADYLRLTAIKAKYDPDNVFRGNHNIARASAAGRAASWSDNGKVVVNLTTGHEDADKVTIAFLIATAGHAKGKQVVMFLTKEAVRLGLPGYADAIEVTGAPPVARLFGQFADGGGELSSARSASTRASSTPRGSCRRPSSRARRRCGSSSTKARRSSPTEGRAGCARG